MTREEFITASEVGLERLLSPLKDLPEALMDEPVAAGKWSVKQILSHLLYWDIQIVLALELLYRREHYDWSAIGDIDEINAREVARRKDTPFKRIVTELRIVHGTLMAAVERIPGERFGESNELPEWLPEIVCDHYLHHAPVIDQWAKKIREQGRGGSTGLPVVQ